MKRIFNGCIIGVLVLVVLGLAFLLLGDACKDLILANPGL